MYQGLEPLEQQVLLHELIRLLHSHGKKGRVIELRLKDLTFEQIGEVLKVSRSEAQRLYIDSVDMLLRFSFTGRIHRPDGERFCPYCNGEIRAKIDLSKSRRA